MKHLITLTILILLTSLNACQRPNYPQTLRQAESMMNTRPDSALHLLQGMADSIAMLPEEAQMYYHLLTIQAKDKQYITHTSDSLINRIVSFYEDYGDKERLMLAYFYQGSTYRDMNDAPRALKAFHQAIDAGKDIKNLTLLGQTYGQMGSLLAKHKLYDEALEVHKKSLFYYEKQGDSSRIPLVIRNIARMYDAKGLKDSAVLFYNQALQMTINKGNSKSANNIISELGCLYYELGEKNTAKQMLRNITLHPSKISNSLLYLGIIYKEECQIDSSRYFFHQVLKFGDLKTQCSAYKYLSQLEESINGAMAREYARKHQLQSDSLRAMRQTTKAENTHMTLNYKRIKKDYESLSQERTFFRNHLMITWGVIVLAGIVWAICWVMMKRKKIQPSIHVERNLMFEVGIFQFFQRASKNECIATENDWAALQKKIEEHYPQYLMSLSDKINLFNLSSHEVKICHLTKLGFTNRAIANILHVTESAISHAKSRLYKRIMGYKGTSAKFLDFIEEL